MSNLTHIGVWTGALAKVPASEARAGADEIERLGFGAVWFPESVGSKEAFSQAALLLSATERIVVASGIANIWARDPMAMVAGANTLGEAWPGRFALGIGVSTDVSVPQRGHQYERPFTTLTSYVEAMADMPYTSPPPSEPVPRLLGSLGPKSIALASRAGWGVHTYFVPPDHTAFAREILGAGSLLAAEQAVIVERNPKLARARARGHMEFYLARSAYRNMLLRLGYSEADLDGGGSDRLVDAVVAWGDAETIRQRVRAHLDAGADHVCIQPIGDGADDVGLDQLRTLAPVLVT